MICGVNTTDNRRLSHYNKTTTICTSCYHVEGAVKSLDPDCLDPKPLFSKWIELIKTTQREISRHAGLTHIRKGVTIYPTPDRDQVIEWISHRRRENDNISDPFDWNKHGPKIFAKDWKDDLYMKDRFSDLTK